MQSGLCSQKLWRRGKVTDKKPKHPKHDELVARILSQPDVLHRYAVQLLGQHEQGRTTVEAEIFLKTFKHGVTRRGRRVGWVDVLYEALRSDGVAALIVEVKSEHEAWSAGDVIRQLKRYADALRFEAHVVCAFHCDRVLTDAEAMLFAHEHVHVLA